MVPSGFQHECDLTPVQSFDLDAFEGCFGDHVIDAVV
jgi:hypothetical protein